MYRFLIKNENVLQISVITTGFTALIVQVIFLREFLNIFSGNELVAGIVLSCWMLLTAVGSYAGKWFSQKGDLNRKIIRLQVAVALLPAFSVFSIYLMKNLMLPPGTLPGPGITFLFSFLIMALFCIFSGMLFTLFASAFSKLFYKPKTHSVYGLEAAGSIAGSLVFTFICLQFFGVFQTLIVVAAANLTVATLMQASAGYSRTGMHLLIITMLMWVIVNMFFDFDSQSKSLVFGNQRIVLNKETPYGNIVVTKSGEQYNFFENGVSMFSTDNLATNEETVHFALAQTERPENVLVVSGDIAGLWAQIDKYPVERVDYVEINHEMIVAVSAITGFSFPEKMIAHYSDARHFIKKTKNRYNAVLLNVPAPGNAGLNRFFTVEFYREVKQILVRGGVISFSLAGGSNYLGGSTGLLYSVVVSSLKSVFKNVLIIPGQTNCILASDGELTHQITTVLKKKGIGNEYVNHYYFDDQQLASRGTELLNQIENTSQLNHDFNPVAYFAAINYWLSWYGQNLRNVVWPVVLLILVFPFFLKRYALGMYVAGFTATSLEVLVLFAFQVLFGNFYQSLALLIAAFMAGLAVGAFLPGWLKMSVTPRKFTINQALIGFIAVFLPAIVLFHVKWEAAEAFILLLLFLVMFFSGVLTAVHFAMAAVLQKNDVSTVASKIYSADLLGSAGGALLVSVLIIPSCGLTNTGFLLGALNLVVTALFFMKGG